MMMTTPTAMNCQNGSTLTKTSPYWMTAITSAPATVPKMVPEQRKVISLIHQLKAQGRGVIFISHNLQDIFAVSDRIVVLRRGIQAGERKISETNHDEVVKLMVGG